MKISENVKNGAKFKFRDVTEEEMFRKIISLDPSKACMKDDIPTKVLLGTGDIVSSSLTKIFNDAKNAGKYPSSFKTADVTPLPKGREKYDKKKYRPVSLTSILSKVFEKHIYEQVQDYAGQFLSPYLFGYRKGHSTEHCLLTMIEMWRKALDEKKVVGGVLTDLSKAFDCLPHDLIIARLHAYGFDKFTIVHSYLTEHT